ncbi:hypothetical protein G6F56_008073 [Rhizopus delemar]|nr:hypothetical protein G6F56_008073 [Rhizopus delemar]
MIQYNTLSELTLVNHDSPQKVNHLLEKLDKGTETATNLQILLSTKTAELNNLVQQLEMIDKALTQVEYGTEQIEIVLKDSRMDHLVYAEATLDSALESACTLCGTSNKTNEAEDENEKKRLMNKLDGKLKQLGIDPSYYFSKSDDVILLQKSIIDLEIAKTISILIKTDYKRRHALMKNKGNHEKIKQLGEKIREEIKLWSDYTRSASFLIQDKNILDLLDSQDEQWDQKKRKRLQALSKLSITAAKSGSVLKLRRLLSKQSVSWFTTAKSVI